MASLEDALGLREASPDVYRYISRGRVLPEHGLCLATPSKCYKTHHSFWRYASVSMHDIFKDMV